MTLERKISVYNNLIKESERINLSLACINWAGNWEEIQKDIDFNNVDKKVEYLNEILLNIHREGEFIKMADWNKKLHYYLNKFKFFLQSQGYDARKVSSCLYNLNNLCVWEF